MTLQNKIDFTVLFTVKNANPNGDPLNGNTPRETYDGYGEVSDVALKRKIRNRLQDLGERIFVQMEERADDGCVSLRHRADSNEAMKKANKNKEEYARAGCESYFDVRAFGQVFAFKAKNKGEGVSVGVRGPVSIHPAFSVDLVDIESLQITKSVMGESPSDTMGTKHRVRFGLYQFSGSINCQLAEKTGFSHDDAQKILEALKTLFENDGSSARPEGSMEVCCVYWWEHNCKSGQYNAAKVHRSVKVRKNTPSPQSFDDYDVEITPLDGLEPTVYELY